MRLLTNLINEIKGQTVMVATAVKTKSYTELANQITAIEKLGKWIAHSRMFGCDNEEQGCVIAADCFITGMPILEYQRRNGLIKGNPYVPYDAMMSAFEENGGKITINSRTPDLASVTLEADGKTREFKLSWEEVQKEPVPYSGKESVIVEMLAKGESPTLKPKWATPRSRAVMLFARCISDGIRVMSSKSNFGLYTPEEIEDFVPSESTSNGNGNGSSVSTKAETSTKQEASPVVKEESSQGSVTDATNTDVGKSEQSLDEPINESQVEAIKNIMAQLKQSGIPDIVSRVKDKLTKHGLSKLADLTIAEGDQLLKALESKQLETWASETLKGNKNVSPT